VFVHTGRIGRASLTVLRLMRRSARAARG
jgi:hypothetical protein